MENGTATLEDSLAVSYKIKYTVTIASRNHPPWNFFKWVQKMSAGKPGNRCLYWLIHNCQSLEATKMIFSKWMDK